MYQQLPPSSCQIRFIFQAINSTVECTQITTINQQSYTLYFNHKFSPVEFQFTKCNFIAPICV